LVQHDCLWQSYFIGCYASNFTIRLANYFIFGKAEYFTKSPLDSQQNREPRGIFCFFGRPIFIFLPFFCVLCYNKENLLLSGGNTDDRCTAEACSAAVC